MIGVKLIYPDVKNEFETIAKVLKGYNLARFGDGEAKIACGFGYSREPVNPKLSKEILQVLQKPNEGVIVGIPTMYSGGPKYTNWLRHAERFCKILDPNLQYYSSFVSRPDSAPWIDNSDFCSKVEQLWAGKFAVVLCEKKGSILTAVKRKAERIIHIECPTHEAYSDIDNFEKEIMLLDPDIAILSCGPTATCLANRLMIHAVDVGSMGKMLSRNL